MDLDGFITELTEATVEWDGEPFLINNFQVYGKMGQAAIERVGQYLADADWKAGAYEVTFPSYVLDAPYNIMDMSQIVQVATGRLFTVRNLDPPQSGGATAFIHLILVSVGRTTSRV